MKCKYKELFGLGIESGKDSGVQKLTLLLGI